MTEGVLAQLELVSRRLGDRTVLSDVDLDIRRGEIVGVMGANGSGKTTLLRILVGLSRPSSGSVLAPPGVAYVPEVFACPDRMSARQYLRHLGRIRGLSGSVAELRGAELMDRLMVTGGADTPVRQLSKGNAQKVALAQALLVLPDLLVLDEPWSGLDPTVHPQFAQLLGDVVADGGAVVVTDHDGAALASVATTTYELIAARLTRRACVSAAGLPLLTIELVAPSELPDLLPWNGSPGVISQGMTGRSCTVQVTAGAQDAVLSAALAARWSVRSVLPAGASEDGSPTTSGRST